MKIKLILSLCIAMAIVLSVVAQTDKKPAPRKKKKEIWDRQLVNKSGNDSRFAKHRKKTFYKPGQNQK